MAAFPLSEAVRGLLGALLIGLIVGAQRESNRDERQAGLRDFLLVSVIGGVCAVLRNPLLSAAALASVTALVTVFYWQTEKKAGITTEIAVVATFCLAYLAALPGGQVGSELAIGVAIIVVGFLEAKRWLHRFIRETVTETEFNDTIWFLAIIFIIYPVLPQGEFGPYGACSPRKIWLFVILVSSISYVGYFLQKFLGTRKGRTWTAILGGLASTTATTLEFGRLTRINPAEMKTNWYATVTANAIQFPRVLLVLAAVNMELAQATVGFLLPMMVAGLVMGALLYRNTEATAGSGNLLTGNPFRIGPALKFGAVFAGVLFLSKAAAAEFGGQGLYWASAAGGTVDADAVAVSLADLVSSGTVATSSAVVELMLALFMNAVLKTGLAAYTGGVRFGWRVAAGFVVMFGVGVAALYASGTV